MGKNIKATELLLEGVKNNNYSYIIQALKNGADVNATDDIGWTPLHWATHGGIPELCRILIQHGANIYVKDKNGKTPFSNAIHEGYVDIIKLLLDAGVDINTRNRTFEGGTALCVYCRYNNEKFAKFLIDLGADPNIPEKSNGCTPLIWAVRNGNGKLCGYLLEHGADPNLRNRSGKSPLDIACCGACLEIAKSLVQHGAAVDLTDTSNNAPLNMWARDIFAGGLFNRNGKYGTQLQELKVFIANYQVVKNADIRIADKSIFEWEY